MHSMAWWIACVGHCYLAEILLWHGFGVKIMGAGGVAATTSRLENESPVDEKDKIVKIAV